MKTATSARWAWLLLLAACHVDAIEGAGAEADRDADDPASADAGESVDAAPDVAENVADTSESGQADACDTGDRDCAAASMAEGGSGLETRDAASDAATGADACSAALQCVDTGVANEACEDGASRCQDDDTLEVCVRHSYRATPCPHGCRAHALGADCVPELALVPLLGSVRFERRLPNAALNDFSNVFDVAAAGGVLVLSYRGELLLDAVLTSTEDAAAGAFNVRVPAQLTATDRLVLMAAGAAHGQLVYAVADPGFAASNSVHISTDPAPSPRIWSWSYDLSAVAPGQVIVVPAALGSGALAVFESVRRSYEYAERLFAHSAPMDAQTIVAWLGLGTIWDCGACMTSDPVRVLGHPFLHQLWLDGSVNEGYWSDAVTAHELGHYLLSAFSAPPSEAGPHYLGVPTHPGLAWSEGWATFWSSWLRQSSTYFDKQRGAFFWIDIDSRKYSRTDVPWQRAVAIGGLTQLIDENEVAALLWGAYQHIAVPDLAIQALQTPRMRVPPFERGYTERSWNDADHPEIFVATQVPHVYLADYLDALRCAALISADTLDEVTEPSARYPYRSGSPLCR